MSTVEDSAAGPTRADLLDVVSAATRMPSVHNTQPWRFVLDGRRIWLYADPSRQLQVLDPDARALDISCGAAVTGAVVTARARGYAASVTWLPRPEDPTCLAMVELAPGHRPSTVDVDLALAVEQRRTYRGAFRDAAVPVPLLDRLAQETLALGVWLGRVQRRDDLAALAALLTDAERAEQADERYRAELRSWLSDGARDDGVPLTALRRENGTVSRLPLRDFTSTAAPATYRTPPRVERSTVLVLGTDDDGPLAWLRAGHALGLVLLRLTAAGAVASPLTQALDHAADRARTAVALRLVGHPQMLLRVGYGEPVPPTPRRPLDAVVSFAGSSPAGAS